MTCRQSKKHPKQPIKGGFVLPDQTHKSFSAGFKGNLSQALEKQPNAERLKLRKFSLQDKEA